MSVMHCVTRHVTSIDVKQNAWIQKRLFIYDIFNIFKILINSFIHVFIHSFIKAGSLFKLHSLKAVNSTNDTDEVFILQSDWKF